MCMCKHIQAHTACVAWCTNLEEFVKEEGEPICKHLLCNRLSSEITSKNRKNKS